MKTLLRFLVIATLLIASTIIPTPAAASQQPTEQPITPILNETGPCTDELGAANYHVGNSYNSSVAAVTAVKAYIDIFGPSFKTCSTSTGPLTHDGVGAWVGIEPANGAFAGIAQGGLIRCREAGNSDCDGIIRYFIEGNGCGAFNGYRKTFGAASDQPHKFELRKFTNSNGPAFGLWIDDVYKGGISWRHSSISCWAMVATDFRADWAGELWDGGDSLADSSEKLHFTNSLFQRAGSTTWYTPNWSTYDVGCSVQESSDVSIHVCDRTGSSSFDLWSVRR